MGFVFKKKKNFVLEIFLQYCIYIYTQIIHFDVHAIFMAMHLKSIKQITYVVFLKIISTSDHKT